MSDAWGIDIGKMLLGLGEDLNREGLQRTPDRVKRAWAEFLIGYSLCPADLLKTTFKAEGKGMQACTSINFFSMCEHHLLPFFGTAAIVYRPASRVAGLSKLARIVDCYARRLQIQERMTEQIAHALGEHLTPKGVLVVCKAKHLCCHGRGVRRSSMEFTTEAEWGKVDKDFWRMLKC
ncbi:hypothetical protein LCGC14_0613070 [marine sediment metagenome]|uniref:GTP cyclohydrolase I n=1 Tax=marine sediment metagenome TaxID=412755 RepID=A0A0F9R780_9ZZZZ